MCLKFNLGQVGNLCDCYGRGTIWPWNLFLFALFSIFPVILLNIHGSVILLFSLPNCGLLVSFFGYMLAYNG